MSTSLGAVLFDIDDTLFPTTVFALEARRAAVAAMVTAGLDFPVEQVFSELLEVIAEFSSNYSQHFNKLLKRLDPELKRHTNTALVIAAGVSAYHDSKFRHLEPFEDVIPTLAYARSRGWKVGIISHGWTDKQSEKLVRLGLVPHLDDDAIFISEDIGINKPNPKLYLRAAERLGLAPGEVMYVGDSPHHDVLPAGELGMRTVWAKRASKWAATAEDVPADHIVDDFEQLREILATY